MRVYVTGPYEATNRHAQERHKQDLDLACRRVLLTGHTPICPVLFTRDWVSDPRFPSSYTYWIRIYRQYMMGCDIFTYVRYPPNVKNERLSAEMELWRELGTGRFISADKIVEVLLQQDATQVLF